MSENVQIVEKYVCENIHTDCVNAVVVFGKPHYKFVTGSDDHTVIIWDSRTFLKVMLFSSDHVGYVEFMLKWNDDSYFSTGNDGTIVCRSIVEPFTMLKRFNFQTNRIIRLLKLDENTFLTTTRYDMCFVVDFDTGTVLRKVVSFKTPCYYCRLALSRKFRECFYVNMHTFEENTLNRAVRLYNWKTFEICRTFASVNIGELNCMNAFVSSLGDEFLIVSGDKSVMIVYKVPIGKEVREDCIVFRHQFGAKCSCSSYILKNYIFIGRGEGTIHIFKFNEVPKNEKIIEFVTSKRIHGHEKRVLYINLLRKASNSEIDLVSVGDDFVPRITTVKGLEMENENEKISKMDFLERSSFLMFNIEDYVHHESEKQRIFINIKLNNCNVESVLKVFLMYQ